MALFPKTKRAASKKAAKSQKKANKAAKNAGGSIQAALESAGPLAAVAANEARDRAADAYKTYAPKAEKAAKKAAKSLKDTNVADRAQKLSADMKGDYLPRAKNTADATNATVTAAVAAAVEAARKEWDKGAVDIKKAYTKPVKKKRGGLGVLGLLVGLAAGGAVAYLVWQKTRPIEDPWAPPADFARAHYPAAASTDADSRDVSDSVASAEAGDVSDALKGGKKPVDPTHPTVEPGLEGKIGEKKPNENKPKN